jgi:hypothetical protein
MQSLGFEFWSASSTTHMISFCAPEFARSLRLARVESAFSHLFSSSNLREINVSEFDLDAFARIAP